MLKHPTPDQTKCPNMSKISLVFGDLRHQHWRRANTRCDEDFCDSDCLLLTVGFGYRVFASFTMVCSCASFEFQLACSRNLCWDFRCWHMSSDVARVRVGCVMFDGAVYLSDRLLDIVPRTCGKYPRHRAREVDIAQP